MIWVLWMLLLVLLGTTVGYWMDWLLTGRHLLRDPLDLLRYHLHPAESWDRRWARNPRRSDILVCLTTTPSRISRIDKTLRSLMAQSVAPLRIRLHLPLASRREGREYVLPDWIWRLRSLEVVTCDDLGPATKLLPALRDLPPQQELLIIDDDALYPPTMIEDLLLARAACPDCALGLSGWVVPPDLTDRPESPWSVITQSPPSPLLATRQKAMRPVDVLRGCDGYLVRPEFFDPILFASGGREAAAVTADDVWISANCRAPKLVIPARRMPFFSLRDWFYFERTALHRLNNPGGRGNLANTALIRKYADRWMCAG